MLGKNNQFGYDYIHDSDALHRKKNARIIMPSKYSDIKGIIYLLHPFGSNRFFWIDFFKIEPDIPYIIVLPESGRKWFINDYDGLRYEDYLISELIPNFEAQFPEIKKRLIGGFSMGGAAAFFLSLKHPNLFDTALSLAGAFEASERIGDPYELFRQEGELLLPTNFEHEKVWGPPGSATRKFYNIPNLYGSLIAKSKTNFIFEVGQHDYDRIIQMNRNTYHFFQENNIQHSYNEYVGNHSRLYAYQGLSRILSSFNL